MIYSKPYPSFLSKCLFRLITCLVILLFTKNQAAGQMRRMSIGSTSDYITKISFYSPSEGYICLLDHIAFSADSGKSLQHKFINNSNVNYNGYSVGLTVGFIAYGVKAFNKDTVIVYGGYDLIPSILYSIDGGNHFTLVYHSQFQYPQVRTGITDLVFPEENNTGYAIDADRILKTTNRGISWFVVKEAPASYFNHLEAVDNNNVFAMSSEPNQDQNCTNKILKTTNGGWQWENILLPTPTATIKLSYVNFISASTGWLNLSENSYGFLYKTIDGGITWTQINNVSINSICFGKMKFLNKDTGYAYSGAFSVYKTINGGSLWERLKRNSEVYFSSYSDFNDLQVLSEQQLWAGGGHGLLECSSNGGGTLIPSSYFLVDTIGVSDNGLVKLQNFSGTKYQYKWFVNNVLISTSFNTSYTHDFYKADMHDTIKLVVTSGSLSDSSIKYPYFFILKPVIYSFEPAAGSVGTVVTIHGTRFDEVNNVQLGGTPASSFTVLRNYYAPGTPVVWDSTITAIVSSGSTGPISLKVDNAWFSSAQNFTFVPASTSLPPVISSISPASGIIGTNVTIQGNGFGNDIANNSVYFGGAKATLLTASNNTITCSVPGGADFNPISVINRTTGLRTYSLNPFNVTFTDSCEMMNSSFINPYLFSKSTYGYLNLDLDIKAIDIDGDNNPDIMGKNNSNKTFYFLRNTTSQNKLSFGPTQPIMLDSSGGRGTWYNAGDLDGDGLPDIISRDESNLTNNGYTTPLIINHNKSTVGNIAFEKAYQYILPFGGQNKFIISDMDNDGKNDLIGESDMVQDSGKYKGSISVIRNTSVMNTISFEKQKIISTIDNNYNVLSRYNIVAGDLNGDGKKEIVGRSSTGFFYLKNKSTPGNLLFNDKISFASSFNQMPLDDISREIKLADIDNDNKLDLIIFRKAYNDNFSVFRNISTDSNILFEPEKIIPSKGNYYTIANVSGDNKPDIIASGNGNGVTIIQNVSTAGNINFERPIGSSSPSNPWTPVSADFNLDGKADLLIMGSDYSTTQINFIITQNGMQCPVTICPNTNINLTTTKTGNSYQWKDRTNYGYAVIDDATFSGSKTNSLSIKNIPSSWYGRQFYCEIDGVSDNVQTIQFVNSFTGNISQTWEEKLNWSCGSVPDSNTDVIIGSGTVTVNNTAAICRSLKIIPGATITVQPGAKLKIVH